MDAQDLTVKHNVGKPNFEPGKADPGQQSNLQLFGDSFQGFRHPQLACMCLLVRLELHGPCGRPCRDFD